MHDRTSRKQTPLWQTAAGLRIRCIHLRLDGVGGKHLPDRLLRAMKRFIWAICLTPLLLPVCAQAQALQARTCEAWNTARKANLSSAVQREWLFGYVNGWRDAQLAQTGQDLFQTMPAVETLIEKANVFCEREPGASVNEVMRVLLKP